MISDQHRVMVGSMNIDRDAYDVRRELGIVADDKALVKALGKTFEADWQAAREAYQKMVGAGRFDEARSVIDQVRLTQPDYRHTRELIAARARLLVAFKKTILNDFKVAGGYPQPVRSLQGITYPHGIQGDEGDMLLAGTPYGKIGVPWTDFSPAVYLAVASYYADASRNPQQAATRRWLAANYALENGHPAEAKTLANAAADAVPRYRQELAQFDEPHTP